MNVIVQLKIRQGRLHLFMASMMLKVKKVHNLEHVYRFY